MRGHIRDYELKKGGKLWAAVVYEGKRVARNGKLQDSYWWIRGFHTQRAAQAELNKGLRSVDDGTYVEESKQTISEYLERWLKTVKPNLGDKTFERNKELVELSINPKLGPIQLAKLQPVQIAELYTWSSTTDMWQLRPTNPANAVKAPRQARKEIKAVEEVAGIKTLNFLWGCTTLDRDDILAAGGLLQRYFDEQREFNPRRLLDVKPN